MMMIQKLIFHKYKKYLNSSDLDKRTLSKLSKDIREELRLIWFL